MKTERLTIRKTTEKDVGLIFDFIKGLASYEKRPWDVTGSLETLGFWLFEKKAATAVIAEYDGLAVGYAIYYPVFGSFSAIANAHLEDLFIKSEYRGRGYGKEFFLKLSKMILNDGYSKLEWSCLDWNLSSIEFYKKIGSKKETGRVYFEYKLNND